MNNHPIVHCITNQVAMDLTANALLAVGARPLMSAALQEMENIAFVADALLINIGTLDDALIQAALLAGRTMHALGKPVVFDPVGVQVSDYRMEAALRIIHECQPSVIKGNADEMHALEKILLTYSGVVVTTGEVDVIEQGNRKEELTGGSPMMTQVTAMGCTAGALIAAYTAQQQDAFRAAVKAMQLMKRAGQAAITNEGLGTYRQRFIDYLSLYA